MNYNNNMFKSQRPIEQFEIAEARKRMGLTNNAQNQMTNTTQGTQYNQYGQQYAKTNTPSLNDSTSTGYSEVQKAKQDMGVQGQYNASQQVPTLSSSTAANSGEIQKAKQDMQQSSSMNYSK